MILTAGVLVIIFRQHIYHVFRVNLSDEIYAVVLLVNLG